MPATKKSFSVKSGLDANANSISNLGASSSSLAFSGGHSVVLTTSGATTLTLPTSGTLLVNGGALGTPSGGNLANCTFPTLNQNTSGSSGSCTGNAATATTASTATKLSLPDLRSTSLTPSYFGPGINGAFMSNSTDSLSDGGTYHGVIQLQQWSDASGGGAHQLGFTDNNNIWHRGSSGGITSWSSWYKLIDSNNIGSQSVTYATSAGSITSQANSATITATSANTANQIVLRDASGNFSAGVMTGTATTARYADLAENYVSDQQYDYGIVLMIGGDEEVTIADEDTQRLAGVVSQNPAYLMNSECEGKHVVAIALQGRTPVRVMGKVNKGDFLVSAGDGYAKATDNPKIGSIIGKSLESFDGQYGMVEVMVGRL